LLSDKYEQKKIAGLAAGLVAGHVWLLVRSAAMGDDDAAKETLTCPQ
jgi:hypothetical protein